MAALPTTGVTRGDAKRLLDGLFKRCMRGRDEVWVPFLMGPDRLTDRVFGVQLTDYAYVAASMRRDGEDASRARDALGSKASFVRELHPSGPPWPTADEDSAGRNATKKYIVHVPRRGDLVLVLRLGYGGNACWARKASRWDRVR